MTNADIETLLFANEAFYVAFAAGDMAAMRGVWVQGAPITCAHPGAPPLFGVDSVMESWRSVLSQPPPIACEGAVGSVAGGAGTVLCYERIGDGYLFATNLFRLESGRWRMFHHHAGPTSGKPEARSDAGGPIWN